MPKPLALEIIELIFENLQPHDYGSADISTLSNCSLVCSAWLPVCRRYTHHRFTFTGKSTSASLDFLSSSPHLIPFIKTLQLDGEASLLPRSEPLLIKTALLLTSVSTLVVRGTKLTEVACSALAPLLSRFLDKRFWSLVVTHSSPRGWISISDKVLQFSYHGIVKVAHVNECTTSTIRSRILRLGYDTAGLSFNDFTAYIHRDRDTLEVLDIEHMGTSIISL